MPVRTSETVWAVGAHEASPQAPAARGSEIGPGPWLTSSVAFAAVLATNWLSLEIDHLKTTLLNANWEYSEASRSSRVDWKQTRRSKGEMGAADA